MSGKETPGGTPGEPGTNPPAQPGQGGQYPPPGQPGPYPPPQGTPPDTPPGTPPGAPGPWAYGQPPGGPPPGGSGNNSKVLWIIAAFVALVLILVVVLVVASDGDGDGDDDGGTGGGAAKSQPAAVKAYLTAVADGDAKKALSLASVEPLDKDFLTDEMLDESAETAEITDIKVSDVADEFTSQVPATFKIGEQTVTENFSVTKSGDDWKMNEVGSTMDFTNMRTNTCR